MVGKRGWRRRSVGEVVEDEVAGGSGLGQVAVVVGSGVAGVVVVPW